MRLGIAACIVILTTGSGTAIASSAPETQTEASAASVRELLAATHATAMLQQVMQQLGQQVDAMVKQKAPCLAPGEVSSALTSPEAAQQMLDLVVPI